MKVIDANVLLYVVNRDAAHHEVITAWWERALNGDETVGLPWIVVNGFLRIATHPRIFPKPLAVEAAIAQVDTWLSQPSAHVVRAKETHWGTLRALLAESGSAGNLTTDAHLASLALTHDATLVSCDADFSRFDGLRWENPLRTG